MCLLFLSFFYCSGQWGAVHAKILGMMTAWTANFTIRDKQQHMKEIQHPFAYSMDGFSVSFLLIISLACYNGNSKIWCNCHGISCKELKCSCGFLRCQHLVACERLGGVASHSLHRPILRRVYIKGTKLKLAINSLKWCMVCFFFMKWLLSAPKMLVIASSKLSAMLLFPSDTFFPLLK